MNPAHNAKSKSTINTLWWMLFSGTAINFMARVCFNIAIVDMVVPIVRTKSNNGTNECYNLTTLRENNNNMTIVNTKKINDRISLERTFLDFIQVFEIIFINKILEVFTFMYEEAAFTKGDRRTLYAYIDIIFRT